MPDGITVRVDARTAYEPDALVYCGPEADPTLEVPNPMIVVEVLSPSTRHIDTAAKTMGYFRLPSVMHYLIVDPKEPFVLHHARTGPDTILTRFLHEGTIALDRPGLSLTFADMYGGT